MPSRCVAVAARARGRQGIRPWLGVENVDLVFLTAIVAVAVRFGLFPSLFASAIASLCYNFFFLPPIYTFTIADPTNIAAFVFFIIMAALVSNVAARVRDPGVTAMARARTTDALYAFSRKLAGVGTLDDVLWATTYQIALMLKVRVVVLLPEQGTSRQGRLSAGGHARRCRCRGGQMGVGERPHRQAAAPTRCPAPSACSCRCAPAAARSASSASTATSRDRC